MSITDELRKYAGRLSDEAARKSEHGFSPVAMALEGIADRIDVEHEAACAEAYGNGVMSVPITLDESQWVKLPVDADGMPIRIGDVMEFSAFEIEKPVTRMVDGIGQGVFFAWCGERGYQQHEAKRYRHHHEPTVEDVLRECCHKYHSLLIDDMNDAINGVERDYIAPDEIIAEFAAKLRLAKEDE